MKSMVVGWGAGSAYLLATNTNYSSYSNSGGVDQKLISPLDSLPPLLKKVRKRPRRKDDRLGYIG